MKGATMGKKIAVGIFGLVLSLVPGLVAMAQDSSVKGNLGGVVVDSTGAVIPGAKVTLTGPNGTQTINRENDGNFLFSRLAPGTYSLKVEKQGFKAADAKGVQVEVGRTASIRMELQPGSATETVEVSAEAITVDTASTASGSNLSDTFYSKVPTQRNVSGLFYVAPGVTDSGGAGQSNPSISGSSGLENLYVADGVNITDAAFGGLGIFTRQYLSVGSGINLTFIKEVQVKTGGFEPQYGSATGGVVQIVTKSGGQAYHGALAGYFAPTALEATRNQIDDSRVNQIGRLTNEGNYDLSGEIGGFVPGFRNNLFFFGAFNPTLGTTYLTPPQFPATNLNGQNGNPLVPNGLFTELGGKQVYTRTFTKNYAAKLTWKMNEKHQLETSVFGDPASTNNSNFRPFSIPTAVQNTTAYSNWDYGTRNWVVRYNGSFSPTWLVNANFTWNNNSFQENPQDPNIFSVTDLTGNGGNLSLLNQGLGFSENHNADNFAFQLDTSKIVNKWGQHTFSIGFTNEFLNYDDFKSRTGGRFPIPDLGAARNLDVYGCAAATGQLGCPIGFLTNAEFALKIADPSCTLCPFYTPPGGAAPVPVFLTMVRGEFGPPVAQTEGLYYAAYANDSWVMNKHFTVNAGLRWEQYRMTGVQQHYTFVDNWAPRVGVVYDPWGDRKSKFYANFGRYNYQMPLDAAIRSLSAELDMFALDFAPASTGGVVNVNPNHSLNITPTAATMLNDPSQVLGGTTDSAIFSNQAATEGFAPGTRMQYEDEWVAGFEREIGHGMVVSARYIDRRLKRVVEDVSGVSPEGAVGGEIQQFVITNPSKSTDLFLNEVKPLTQIAGSACSGLINFSAGANGLVDANGNVIGGLVGQQLCFPNGAVAGSPGADGTSDGFINPVRNYQAMELELNKSFSHGWLMRFNYRLAFLRGNYEGAFRNDKGQTDPSISSLFDFTAGNFNLLGNQFAIGPLNTDRLNTFNAFFSYTFDHSRVKGLTLGTGLRLQSGTPINELADHPVYGNAGEVPIGGRGSLGRTDLSGAADLHADYVFKMGERSRIRFGTDLFNITNSQPITRVDQFRDLSFSGANSNPDFLAPTAFQRSFNARFSARWEF